MHIKLLFIISIFSLTIGCGSSGGGSGSSGGNDGNGGSDKKFIISSSSYTDGGDIPAKNTCDGVNQSPQYSWSNPPTGTTKYALIMDDIGCGTGTDACPHWGLFNIPLTTTSLEENQDITAITGAVEGKNYRNGNDYDGPCPPSEHTYKTVVYALKNSMPIVNGNVAGNRSTFQTAYSAHILATATYSGLFGE